MAEKVLELILSSEQPIDDFVNYFNGLFEDRLNQCTIEEFAIFFLGFIRSQTEEFTKVNTSICNTPKKFSLVTPTPNRKHSLTATTVNENAGNKTVSRDLFIDKQTTSSTDDFIGAFSKLDERDQDVKMDYSDQNLLQKRNESDLQWQQNNSTILDKSLNNDSNNIVDVTFSPILTQNKNRNSNCSTPIKSTSSRTTTTAQLNTSTLLGGGNSTNNRSKGSRNSSFDKSISRNSSLNTSTPRRPTNSPCLGDFINFQIKTKRKSTNNNSNLNNNTNKTEIIFSDNDFPNLDTTKPKTSTSNPENKPKKRVAPITISKIASSRHDFTSSSFKSDNNLISFMNISEDYPSQQQPTAKDERGLLKNFKEIIKNDFEESKLTEGDNTQTRSKMLHIALKNTIETPKKSDSITSNLNIDLSKVSNRPLIDHIVNVYTVIMDLNLTPNVLSELSYLINLINTEYDPFDNYGKMPSISFSLENEIDSLLINDVVSTDYTSVLKNLNNCIYFALQALDKQKFLLASLDNTTIKVLIDNERLSNLNKNLHSFLKEIHSCKSQLDTINCNGGIFETSLTLGGNNNTFNNVFYQQENDTKENFPSDREFGAFKKQRDVFYIILRTWEYKHLNPSWNFLTELGGKVRLLLGIMEHPINMAHLAKLFTAQLIISCNFDNSTSELQMALPNVDLTKLSKLRQRLVAPSLFSTQYLFPGSQAFFRDFILAAENNILFIEQLKIALIYELQEMNNSSYEVLNVSNSNNPNANEYVVRPESTSTMRVLAKFIGYVTSRPFMLEISHQAIVENRQIELRNHLLPAFDIKAILLKSIYDRKIIITIPWLVQYLVMLDNISLRLNYYKDVFEILYELYISTNAYDDADAKVFVMTPTSKFIVRACLGWLFEHPNVPEEYYSYRQNRKSLDLLGYKKIEIYVDKSVTENVESNTMIIKQMEGKFNDMITCDIEPIKLTKENLRLAKFNENLLTKAMNPLLENILNAACPFLADFRVSVMPSRMEKTVSRTGRYRHITTKYTGSPNIQQKSTNNQKKLIEAFLQTQSLSLRRTVEFVIERTTSATVKDFQVTHLIPMKKAVQDEISQIGTSDTTCIAQEMYQVYSKALQSVNAKWDTVIPHILDKRVKEGFNALLPKETLEPVKMTCINLSIEKCFSKVNEWKTTNMSGIELFCKDISTEAAKLKSSHNKMIIIPLKIDINKIAPALVFEKLQQLIHKASINYHALTMEDVLQEINLIYKFLDEQNVTGNMYKIAAFMLLQLVVILVSNRCDIMTMDLIDQFIEIWKHKKLSDYTTPPSVDEELSPTVEDRTQLDESYIKNIQLKQYNDKYIFLYLISNRFIRLIEDKEPQVFFILSILIDKLLENKLISIAILNEQFVRIFKEDWQPETLAKVSYLMETVKTENLKRCHSMDDSQSHIFLEVLSELAKEIDYLI